MKFESMATLLGFVIDAISLFQIFTTESEVKKKSFGALFLVGFVALAVGLFFMFGFGSPGEIDGPSSSDNESSYAGTSDIDMESFDMDSSDADSFMVASVGDHFFLGQYPQGSNGEIKPIEWRVLFVENGNALVISERLLDCVRYNASHRDITWEESSLRTWMNSNFMNKAFNSDELSKIIYVINKNSDNPEFGTYGGNNTEDRVFALSAEEAKKYFLNDSERMGSPTAYAKSRGSYFDNEYSLPNGEHTGWWWLRSPGKSPDYVSCVRRNGQVFETGCGIISDLGSVRPAMWIKL